jgi:hypothetical protein
MYSQTEKQEEPLTQKLSYTQKDYFAFMRKNRNYSGFSVFYDLQNFPNAANKNWMSNMHSIGTDVRILSYPLLLNAGVRWKNFGKINSPQIPAFQSSKINKYELGGFVSLSVFPLPYIPALKRTQEYVSPYAGIGSQWESLSGWTFDSYDGGFYQLNLSSWYWQVGCNIFLGDFIPLDLFVEYAHTLNSDKIRNYEWLRIGITLRYTDLFKYISRYKKSFSKPLIQPK